MFLCPGKAQQHLSPHIQPTPGQYNKKRMRKMSRQIDLRSASHTSVKMKSGSLSSNSTLRHIPIRTESKDSDTLTPMFIAALFIIAKW